jgi:hypothetical protein
MTRRPDSRISRAERDATSRAGASGVSTARSWPRRAGVRSARSHAFNQSLPRQNHGSTAGCPEPRARRVASSRHGGAPRGFPSAQHNGARRRRAPGVLAHWLGVAAARRLLWSPFTNTRSRRSLHGDGGAQGHNRPRSTIRRGAARLRRKGQHTGKNSAAMRLHTWEANTGRNPRGRREKKGRGAHGGATV